LLDGGQPPVDEAQQARLLTEARVPTSPQVAPTLSLIKRQSAGFCPTVVL